jgi:uncharacterized protein
LSGTGKNNIQSITSIMVKSGNDSEHRQQILKIIVWITPFLIVLIGNIAARISSRLLGNWAWTGYFPIYWGMIMLVLIFAGKKENQRSWFQKSQGSRWWRLLAAITGIISFPLFFFPNLHLLNSFALVAALCTFAVVNSIFEETFWRGYILDGTSHLPRSVGIIYSTILFTVIHPLNLGVFSEIQAFDPGKPTALIPFLGILILLSMVYNLLYLKSKSLRLSIFSHFLTDIGNLSVLLFMNRINF